MTAQLSDSVLYRNRTFSLCGVKGTGLFDPHQHGLKPRSTWSACWRGYICTYKVTDGTLILDALQLMMAEKAGQEPLLFGQRPTNAKKPITGLVVYSGLDWPVPFSGGMLLAEGFIRKLYVHMGFHPAWKFEKVHELLFRDGKLVEEKDCSEAMAQVRERLASKSPQPGSSASRSELEAWIAKTFSLDY